MNAGDKNEVRAELSRLLDRLEAKAEEGYARLQLRGRAVGKGSDTLHMSVPMGIVAVPLDEIERLDPLSAEDPTLVAITVRNGDRIKPLFTVDWFNFPDRRPGSRGGLTTFGGPSPTDIPSEICTSTYKNVCTDTGTDSPSDFLGGFGGGAAKDDTICGSEWADQKCSKD